MCSPFAWKEKHNTLFSGPTRGHSWETYNFPAYKSKKGIFAESALSCEAKAIVEDIYLKIWGAVSLPFALGQMALMKAIVQCRVQTVGYFLRGAGQAIAAAGNCKFFLPPHCYKHRSNIWLAENNQGRNYWIQELILSDHTKSRSSEFLLLTLFVPP